MNVYEKLQTARMELQSTNLKKSGSNKFAQYEYFELSDFLPAINEIFHILKLFSQISFSSELATLTITNIEKPEETIVFTSPMAEANLKGCHPIQNLGAVETYNRRYLYVTALEIVEHDALDAVQGKEETPREQSKQTYKKASPQEPQKATQPNPIVIKAKYKAVHHNTDKYDEWLTEQKKTKSLAEIERELTNQFANKGK